MKKRDLILTFSSLSLGEHALEYHLNDAFFVSYENSELEGLHAPIEVKGSIRKANNMLELHFGFEGQLDTLCDVSRDPITISLKNQMDLVVKFGEAFDDSDPDLLILPQGEFEMDLSQILYDLVALSLPMRRVKPEFEVQDDEDEDLDDLNELLTDN